MQATERGTPAANARYVSTVITEAACIIDKTAKAGHEWSVYDALRQANNEYGAREAERNDANRSYGMTALLSDLGKYIEGHPTALEVHFPEDWTPVSRWSHGTDPETVTATLREAAPAIAEDVRKWTARAEAAQRKVQVLNLSEEEVLEEILTHPPMAPACWANCSGPTRPTRWRPTRFPPWSIQSATTHQRSWRGWTDGRRGLTPFPLWAKLRIRLHGSWRAA